jgi:putative cofactor-binding repeat protein
MTAHSDDAVSDPKVFSRILAHAFPWLHAPEAEKVATALHEVIQGESRFKDKMQACAYLLERHGLRASAPLLQELVGRGSKRDAVDIVREVARYRFDQAQASLTGQVVQPTSSAMPALLPTDDLVEQLVQKLAAHPIYQTPPQMTPPATNDQAAADLVHIRAQVDHLVGHMKWLTSTIETERRLRQELMKNHGAHDHHVAAQTGMDAVEAARGRVRRGIIEDLGRSLEANRFGANGGVKPEPTGQGNIARARLSEERDPLDL